MAATPEVGKFHIPVDSSDAAGIREAIVKAMAAPRDALPLGIPDGEGHSPTCWPPGHMVMIFRLPGAIILWMCVSWC